MKWGKYVGTPRSREKGGSREIGQKIGPQMYTQIINSAYNVKSGISFSVDFYGYFLRFV